MRSALPKKPNPSRRNKKGRRGIDAGRERTEGLLSPRTFEERRELNRNDSNMPLMEVSEAF